MRQGGGLPRPVRADEAEQVGLVHGQIEVAEGHHVAVEARQAEGLNGGDRVHSRGQFGEREIGAASRSMVSWLVRTGLKRRSPPVISECPPSQASNTASRARPAGSDRGRAGRGTYAGWPVGCPPG